MRFGVSMTPSGRLKSIRPDGEVNMRYRCHDLQNYGAQWCHDNGPGREYGYDFRECRGTFHGRSGDQWPQIVNNFDEFHEMDTGRKYVFYNGDWTLFDHGWKQEVATAPAPKTYPTNCKNCGAVLHSHICEYCGSEYHDV